jgi:integrase
MRITSVTSLEREQVRVRGDGSRALLVKVKKKGRVEVELPTSSAEALDQWLARAPESKYVFPALRGKGALTRRAISQRLTEYGRRTGVKNAAPHRFRATYITEAFDAGVPLNEIQAAVHHSDPNSTQRYDRGVRGAGVAGSVSKFRNERK